MSMDRANKSLRCKSLTCTIRIERGRTLTVTNFGYTFVFEWQHECEPWGTSRCPAPVSRP